MPRGSRSAKSRSRRRARPRSARWRYYVSHADPANYQPTNIAFGIIPPLEQQIRSRAHRKTAISERALRDLDSWMPQVGVHAGRRRSVDDAIG